MNIHPECLPCVVNQAVRTARMTGAKEPEELYRKIFAHMSQLDFQKTNPEIIGETFAIIKAHLGTDDPYRDTKARYNRRFMDWVARHEQSIPTLEDALMYAAAANIIDFNPVHQDVEAQIHRQLAEVNEARFARLDTDLLRRDLSTARTVLYLGDNCGEICFDKLVIQRIREACPHCRVYFGVRGQPVVNDATAGDAAMVGMEEVATVIPNGDGSLGTVLRRVSPAFLDIWRKADVVIAKGQGNYESLCQESKPVYFLMTVKCGVVARMTGYPQGSLLCMRQIAE